MKEPINFINKLVARENLTFGESQILMSDMVKGKLSHIKIAAILTALRIKGESTDEILGFVDLLRDSMTKIKVNGAIDTCGTGGDGASTFNISTTAAIVVSGLGVKVAKHGNRKASSLCGSADVFEALGVNINLTPQQAEDVLIKVGMVFLFAPLYHQGLKNVVPVRKELGIRTVFNFLGPFLNPASVKRQLIGVSNLKVAKNLAQVARRLDYEKVFIVSSGEGLDEVSISSATHVFEITGNKIRSFTIKPEEYGIKKSSLEKIKGRNALENALIIKEILKGKKGPKRDIVLLNSALALVAAGKAFDIYEGIKLAKKSIDDGHALRILEKLIIETKKYG